MSEISLLLIQLDSANGTTVSHPSPQASVSVISRSQHLAVNNPGTNRAHCCFTCLI